MNVQTCKIILALVCIWLPLAHAADVDEVLTHKDSLATLADRYMESWVAQQQFSGAVLLARDGRIMLSRGYGLANRELNVANSTATKFRIGSLTKQFKAAAILLLQERNKLKVSQSICLFIEDCPAVWQPITLHHLLTHTSGIPNKINLPGFTELVPPETVINGVKDLPLDFVPGARFNYSNPGYILLGMAIEKASGKNYGDFLRDEIFLPLRMRDTDYDDASEILVNRAAGYSRANDIIINAAYTNMSVPFSAGALHSTVEDFLRWDQALYGTKVLSKKSLASAFTPFHDGAGYGWFIGQDPKHPVISHAGRIDGFTTFFARYLKDRVAIIVFANLEDLAIEDIGKGLADLVWHYLDTCSPNDNADCRSMHSE